MLGGVNWDTHGEPHPWYAHLLRWMLRSPWKPRKLTRSWGRSGFEPRVVRKGRGSTPPASADD